MSFMYPIMLQSHFNEESVRYPIILSTISGFNNTYIICIYVCGIYLHKENQAE